MQQARRGRATRAARLAMAAALALAPAWPGAALAAKPSPQQEAEELASRAKAAFKAGQFEQAAKDFMAAYGRSKNAALVFNAARAYQEAGRLSDAAVLFRLYLSISDDADGMRDAQARLEAIDAALRAGAEPKARPEPAREAAALPTAATPTSPGPPPPAPSPVAADPAAATPPGAAAARSAAQAAPALEARAAAAPTPAVVWWLGVPGTLALGSGVALLILGQNGSEAANQRSITSAGDIDAYHSAYGRARDQWQAGAVLAGAGAVAVGASLWLAVRAPRARVAVAPANNGLGVAVAGWW